MDDWVLFQQCIKRMVIEMSTLATNDSSTHAIIGENIFIRNLTMALASLVLVSTTSTHLDI